VSEAKQKFAIIGVGNLGSAVAVGLTRSALAPDLLLVNRSTTKAESLANRLPNAVACDLLTAAEQADVFFIAVKPAAIAAVCDELSPLLARRSVPPLIVSVAASPTLSELRQYFGATVPLARVMPTIAVAVGAGFAAVYAEEEPARDQAKAIFESMGKVMLVASESEFDAVLGISASGIGFVALVAEALADGGLKMGLRREDALQCAAQTLLGAGLLLDSSGMHPVELRARVASPGGTTIAGLHELEKAGVRGAFISAIEAAVNRVRTQ